LLVKDCHLIGEHCNAFPPSLIDYARPVSNDELGVTSVRERELHWSEPRVQFCDVVDEILKHDLVCTMFRASGNLCTQDGILLDPSSYLLDVVSRAVLKPYKGHR